MYSFKKTHLKENIKNEGFHNNSCSDNKYKQEKLNNKNIEFYKSCP